MTSQATQRPATNPTVELITKPIDRPHDGWLQWVGDEPQTNDVRLVNLAKGHHQRKGGSRYYYAFSTGYGMTFIWQRHQGDIVTIQLKDLATQA